MELGQGLVTVAGLVTMNARRPDRKTPAFSRAGQGGHDGQGGFCHIAQMGGGYVSCPFR